MKQILFRLIFFLTAIIGSSLFNTYIIDSLLEIFNIMSYIALLLNRVSLALFIYFILETLFIIKKFFFRSIINKLFLIYMIWLVGLLFGRITNLSDYSVADHFNFQSFLPLWINHLDNKLVLYFIVGNILVYLPFGLYIRYHKGIIYSILYCILLIILFECIQGVTNLGYFDIDDILLNGIGGLFGILIMSIIKKIFHLKIS